MGTTCSSIRDSCERLVTGKTETFCFCFSPKQAAVISGIGTILFYLAALVYLFVKWAQLSEVALDIMALFQNLSIWLIVYTYFKMFMFVLIVPIVLQMLLGGFLLYGCWKASKRFMMPWMVMTPYTLCLAAFVSLYTTFTLNALHIFYFFFCVFCIYVWFCVSAYYKSTPEEVEALEK